MARLTREGRLLHDLTVKFQVYLERLKAGEVRKIESTIRSMDRIIVLAIHQMGNNPSRRELDSMLLSMRSQLLEVIAANTRSYMETLEQFSRYASQYTVSTIRVFAPPSTPVATPNAASAWAAILSAPIQATGDLMEPFIGTWGLRAIRMVEGAIRVGYVQGLTTDQIIRAIRGTQANRFRDGILGNATRREAAAMVRTALQHTSMQAQQQVYAENERMIEGYYWISTLDDRTSTTCRSLDGRFFKMGKGPVPPIHINCRSATIPKIAGINIFEAAPRAAMGGPVEPGLTYYQWLKTMPADFQDDVLGPTRAKLFRDGGLSAEEFARLNLGRNFEPLTLEQMRKKNPAAFTHAGL